MKICRKRASGLENILGGLSITSYASIKTELVKIRRPVPNFPKRKIMSYSQIFFLAAVAKGIDYNAEISELTRNMK